MPTIYARLGRSLQLSRLQMFWLIISRQFGNRP